MNTKPSTPFGKFFAKCGVWHPSIEEGVVAAYNLLHEDEKKAITSVSGIISIINTNVRQTPDFIFNLITSKYPAVTKEAVTDLLNHINAEMNIIDGQIPDDFDAALTKLQTWLSGFGGKSWVSIVRAVVEVGATFLKQGLSVQTVSTVLEYIYQMLVKPNVNA